MQAKQASNVKVIDVSHHQGIIDWKKVKGDGVLAVFIKASEGCTFVDSNFKMNVGGALAESLKVGLYHYANPELDDAKAEAAHFAEVVKGIKADFPHVLDVEGDAAQIGADKLTTWCMTWLKEVERLTGHPGMIYTGASFAHSNLGKQLAQWPLWVAHYGVEQPMRNDTWDKWSMFQYSSTGHVSGVIGNVDVNAMELTFYTKWVTPDVPQPTADENVPIVVNDKLVAYGRLIDGHAYLALRPLGKALGLPVEWHASEATPYIGGKPLSNYKLISGTTYIGVRAAAELFGGIVLWDGKTKKVSMNK